MYMNSSTLHVGVAHPRPHLPAVLSLIERGLFDPTQINPTVVDWEDAPRALIERATKVILRRAPLGLKGQGGPGSVPAARATQ
jgi:alcohol dehydrogenase